MERSGNAVRTSHQQAGGAGEGVGGGIGWRGGGQLRGEMWEGFELESGRLGPSITVSCLPDKPVFFFVLGCFFVFSSARIFSTMAQSHLVFACFIWAVWPLGRIVQTVHIKWAMQNKLGAGRGDCMYCK